MDCSLKSPIAEAKNVLNTYQPITIPIDVKKLCEKLNIDVKYVSFAEIEAQVGKEIDGIIQKSKDGNFRIYVKEDSIDARVRFTIAHELGHYFLHMKDSEAGKVLTSFRMDSSPKETEANQFAAELLMPEDYVRAEYKKMFIPISDSLAQTFNVSKMAMQFRLKNLGLAYV